MTRSGDTAADFAARFGVTVKALRVYEREGLLKPARTEKGWRAYGRPEEERLTAILALKRLGLPLAGVRQLMAGFNGDLDAVLALQEQALAAREIELRTALALIRTARVRLASGETLSTGDLTQLVKETAMIDTKWTPEMQALADKHYTKDQQDELKARKFDAGDQAVSAAAWGRLFAEGEQLRHGDPASPQAQDWARRWKLEVEKFTLGRKDLWDSAARFNTAALADPATKSQMPGSPEVWAFASAAMKILVAGN